MESAFNAPDAAGAWDWKTAYDAAEAASVLFLRRYGPTLIARASVDADLFTSIVRLPSVQRNTECMEAVLQDLDQRQPDGDCHAAVSP